MKPLCPHQRAYRLQTLLLALVTGLLSFGLFLLQNGGFFTIVDVFNAQQIPFTYAISNALDPRPLGGWFLGIDLGEILMWWGAALASIAALKGVWQLVFGAILNTLMFLCISIPIADRHQARKDGFDAYKVETHALRIF